MNPSINSYVDLMSTARGSDFERWSYECHSFSSGSRFLCVEVRYVVNHDSYLIRSLPRSIAALLVVVYSADAGVVPKGNHRQRRASLSNISMQVEVAAAFAWIQR